MGVYDLKSKPTTGEDSLKAKYAGNSPLSLKEGKNATVATYLRNKSALEDFSRKISLYKESNLLNENQIKPDSSE